MLEKSAITQLMPHGESMCLVDRVVSWGEGSIECSTLSHIDANNPLIENDVLPVLALVEYGAQAAAIHGALLGNNSLDDARKNKPAFLGAVKALELFADDVPKVDAPLEIMATNEMFSANGAIYDFTASVEGKILAKGRLSLLVPA